MMEKRRKRKTLSLSGHRTVSMGGGPVTQNYPYSPYTKTGSVEGRGGEVDEGCAWSQLTVVGAEAPSGRYGHCSAEFGRMVFVFGGFNSEVGTLDDMWAYSLDACVWTRIEYASSASPSPRFYHASLVHGDAWYIFGGLHVADESASAPEFCDDLWRFSFASLRWRKMPAAGQPPHGRHNAALVAFAWPSVSPEALAPIDRDDTDADADAAASAMGMRTTASQLDIPGLLVALSETDAAPDAAPSAPPPPPPAATAHTLSAHVHDDGDSVSPGGSVSDDDSVARSRSRAASGSGSALAAAAAGSSASRTYLYLCGGYGPRSALLYRYDLVLREWRIVLTKGPVADFRAHTLVVAGHKAWLFGGRDGKVLVNDVFCFDFLHSTWAKIPVVGDVPTRRFGHSALVQGAYMYVFGGVDKDGTCSDLFRFSFARTKTGEHEWTRVVTRGHTPCGRYYHTAAMTPTQSMIVFGGYSDHAEDKKLAFLNDAYAIWIDPIVIPPSSVAFDLAAMLVSAAWSDVVLRVGSTPFPAHRVVLAARSPVFRALFDLADAPSPAAAAKVKLRLRAMVVSLLAASVLPAGDPMAPFRHAWTPHGAARVFPPLVAGPEADDESERESERGNGAGGSDGDNDTSANSAAKSKSKSKSKAKDKAKSKGKAKKAKAKAKKAKAKKAKAKKAKKAKKTSAREDGGVSSSGCDGGLAVSGSESVDGAPYYADGEWSGGGVGSASAWAMGGASELLGGAAFEAPLFAGLVTSAGERGASGGADADEDDDEAERTAGAILEFVDAAVTVSAAESESGKAEVVIPGMSAAAFEVLLRFAYVDAVPAGLDLETMVALLEGADLCLLPRLKLLCMRELRDRISLENVTQILLAADARSAHALKAACLGFISGSLDRVRSHPSFSDLILNPDLLFEVTMMVADHVGSPSARPR